MQSKFHQPCRTHRAFIASSKQTGFAEIALLSLAKPADYRRAAIADEIVNISRRKRRVERPH